MTDYSKITALYSRLSVGDEDRDGGESNSIQNQKIFLENYARGQHLTNIRHYIDDDESGRFFDRSAYSRMMDDVENGKIGVCIMKDLTRWGRDYLQVGNAMEIFRRNNVRFIAVNNGIDSEKPDTLEFAPFINIMSEWYAKDISKKVKTGIKTKGMSGKPIVTEAPYGYVKDPDNKDFWIIDEEAAAVVRLIFRLFIGGKNRNQIAVHLKNEQIPTPTFYMKDRGRGTCKNKTLNEDSRCKWNKATLTNILTRQEYCGDVVNFKTTKHFRDKHKGNVEIWRAAWAAYTNQVLESAGRPERIDHRSYKRQGIDKIPSVHLGPAASQMEKRGIRTDKGEVNRQIAADNKLLKEIKARITRLYRWSKAEAEKPQTQQSSLTALWEAQQQLNAPRTRTGKIRALQESAALFSFLQANGIQSMQQLHEKIADMNSRYYDLRGKIVKAERRIATLTERGEMWEQYNQYKSIHKQLAKVKPEKREQFEQRHSRELILYDAAARYLKELKDSGEGITPKTWQREIDQLAAGKQTDTLAMKSMREDLKAVERLRKTAEQLSRQERDKPHDREPER